jgi:osmotically inducible protein OsmC
MAAQSTATTVWQGDLAHGSGTTIPGSGAFPEVPVSWASRTARSAGKTSPEELLAAAHTSCYSMALAHGLAEGGNPPDRLDVTATVTFVPGEGVKSSELVVSGSVPGIDQDAFAQAARDAAENCPISAAMKGNVDITIDATLASQI